jgi:hypothetical protein
MAKFETVVSEQLAEEIVRLAASGMSAPAICERLSDSLDYPPSVRTIQRVVKRRAAAVSNGPQARREQNRAVDPLNDGQPRTTASGHRFIETPAFPSPAEPPADRQGFNARQRAGLPAMPPEETTAQFLAREYPGRRFYQRSEVTLDETGLHASGGFSARS